MTTRRSGDGEERLTGAATEPTVLVVDDDEGLADTYALWLQEEYDVRVAYSGEEAIEAFDDDVDVVLLDRRMPGMPGDTVLEELREQDPEVQISMLTAVEPDSDIVDLPFDEYLVKPVTQADIRDTVEELLLRSRFDEEAQEYFALESTEQALEGRDPQNLRDTDVVEAMRDRAERAREESRLAELQTELDRLKRISRIVRDVDRALVAASTREEIEETVCDRIAAADPYEFVWIGEYAESFDQVTPRTAAPVRNALLRETVSGGGDDPVTVAVEGGEVQVVPNVTAADTLTLPVEWSGRHIDADAAEYAAVVVPLLYHETVYGTLQVYTRGEFSPRDVEVFADLGSSIANAINGVERKKLMLSDTVVELEFEIRDGEDVFVDLSEEIDGRVELKGFVPAANGALTCYVAVATDDASPVFDTIAETDHVESVRGINDSGTERLYECVIDGSTVALTLLEAGANVRSLVIDRGNGKVTAEVAPDTDVRTVVEAVRSGFDDVEFVAKREQERKIQSTDSFRKALEDRLTDRQRAALEAAYSAGYFDWPRGSTAEEIADSMGLAPPTLHEHLRGAQRSLIETFFDEVNQ